MPTVKDILKIKGTQIHCIDDAATVLAATQKMNEHKIGALVVTSGGKIAGIFTERDVLRRVVVEERPPANVTVGQVMSKDLIICSPQTDLDEVAAIMKQRRIRHLPVCDSTGQLQGLVSIGDLNAFTVSNQEATIHFLNDYIYGRV